MTGVLDAVATWVFLGLVGMLLGQRYLGRPWWRRFWWWASNLLDPLRRIHWSLPAIVVGIGLFVWLMISGNTIGSASGGVFVLLWLVLSVLSIWWFLKGQILGRLSVRRHKKALKKGFALPMAIWSVGGKYGRLDRWLDVVSLPKRSVVVVGAPGAGKTEAAIHLVHQMLADWDSLFFVYDHKDDFQEFFDEIEVSYVRISKDDSSVIWNLFQEFEDEQDIDEFARALFPQATGGDNDFFADMGRQVFAAVIKAMIRENDGVEGLSNADLRRYFQVSTVEDVHEDLSAFPDLRGAASGVDVETSPKQAQGVYSSVQRVVGDVLIGDFGAAPVEGRGFSIREYAADPGGVPVVFDYPAKGGKSTKPVFRFLIDHAAMYGMSAGDRHSYFVLDEFAQIPHLRQIEELVNVGRGQNVETVVTLQSVKQLYANYGEDRGDSILAGLVSMILLRPNDETTVNFIRSAIGTEFHEYTQHVEKEQVGDVTIEKNRETRMMEEHPFSKGEIRKWDAGVGVVVTKKGWLHGYIQMISNGLMGFVENVIVEDTPEIEGDDHVDERPDGSLEDFDTEMTQIEVGDD